MKSFHEGRIARAARAIAARLENQPEVRLYVRSERAEDKILRIHHYMNRYIGKYCFEWWAGIDENMIVVQKIEN